jgi:AraC-like DNA-binding protein
MPSGQAMRAIDTMLLPTQGSALLLRIAQAQNIDAADILRGTGLKLTDLDDDETWISYRQTMRIVDNAYQLTGREDLGLEVGFAEDMSSLGILGYAMASCDTVGEALSVGAKYSRTTQNLCDLKLVDENRQLRLYAATPFLLSSRQYRFAIEELFASIVHFVHILSGKEVYPERVEWSYADPGYPVAYQQVFHCPLIFDSAENCLVLRHSTCALPIPQGNRFNARMGEKMCLEILRKFVGEDDLATRTRQIILQTPGQMPSEADMAGSLAVSGRTLRRKLGELGTSYRQLTDEVRSELAQHYLRDSGFTVEHVSHLLGYTETTNFRRAFKRWTGVSPRKYRLG